MGCTKVAERVRWQWKIKPGNLVNPNVRQSKMHRFLQYRTRSLLAATFLAGAAIAMYLKPYYDQKREIARLKNQDVHVTTSVYRPAWLGEVAVLDAFYERPTCALILIQPAGESRLHVLNRDLSFDEANRQLKRLRQRLGTKLGTDRVMLVQHGDFPRNAIFPLFKLCDDLDAASNPCGVELFPASSLVPATPFSENAEP